MYSKNDGSYLLKPSPVLRQWVKSLGRKTDKFSSAIKKHEKMLRDRQKLFRTQLLTLLIVAASFALVMIINAVSPEFFVYQYFRKSVNPSDILRFWPLFAWGFMLSVFVSADLHSTRLNTRLLFWGLVTGNMAALWEEFGYRFVFICFGMIYVITLNWLLGTVFIWALVLLAGVAVIGILASENVPNVIVAIIPTAIAIGLVFLAGTTDPLFWFYQTVIMRFLNFVSFGSYTDIINPELHQPLLVMGALAANTWFRDGHKYQGLFGLLDAWMFGFVAIYATLTYGLLVAFILHGMLNTQIVIINYIRRQILQ